MVERGDTPYPEDSEDDFEKMYNDDLLRRAAEAGLSPEEYLEAYGRFKDENDQDLVVVDWFDESALQLALRKGLTFDDALSLIDKSLCTPYIQEETQKEIIITGGMDLRPLFPNDQSIVLFDITRDFNRLNAPPKIATEHILNETKIEYPKQQDTDH